MLCNRCGTNTPKGCEICPNCGQELVSKEIDTRSLSGSFDVIKRRRRSLTEPPIDGYKIGDIIGNRYHVRELIGAGPLGTMYRVLDQAIDQEAALKLLKRGLLKDDAARAAFSEGIKRAKKLNHPNIVKIFDQDCQGAQPFFTCQLLEGLTLRKLMQLRKQKGESFRLREVEPILAQVCLALQTGHRIGPHGDLKPENIFILPDSIRLADYGVAAAIGLKPFIRAQQEHCGIGSLAPEIRRGQSGITTKSDIWALGRIFSEMLIGNTSPPEGKRLHKCARNLSESVSKLYEMATSDSPEDRYRDAEEFFENLTSIIDTGKVITNHDSVLDISVHTLVAAGMQTKLNPDGANDALHMGIVNDDDLEEVDSSDLVEEDDEDVEEFDDDIEELDDDAEEIGDEDLLSITVDEDVAEEHSLEHDLIVSDAKGSVGHKVEEGEVDSSDALEVDGDEEEIYEKAKDRQSFKPLKAVKPLRPIEDELDHSKAPLLQAKADDLQAFPTQKRRPSTQKVVQRSALKDPAKKESSSGMSVLAWVAVILFVVAAGTYAFIEYMTPSFQNTPVPLSKASQPAAKKGLDLPEGATQAGEAKTPVKDDGKLAAVTSPTRIESDEDGEDPTAAAVAKVDADQDSSDTPAPADDPSEGESEGPVMASAAAAEQAGTAPDSAAPGIPTQPQKTDGEQPQEESAQRQEVEAFKTKAQEMATLLARPPEVAPPTEPAETKVAPIEPEPKPEPEPEKAKTKPTPEREDPSPTPPPAVAVAPTPPTPPAPAPAPAPAQPVAQGPPPGTPPQAAAASAQSTLKCPAGMILILAGQVGASSQQESAYSSFDGAGRRVETDSYCIDAYEYPGRRQMPLVNVTWQQAKSLCEQRGKRLCTEKEWERSCKGPRGYNFPYGNAFQDGACNTENLEGIPRAVAPTGTFTRCRSGYGVYDLSGNVGEWTLEKVVRGGAADRPDYAARCAGRARRAPTASDATTGFRCCAKAQ